MLLWLGLDSELETRRAGVVQVILQWIRVYRFLSWGSCAQSVKRLKGDIVAGAVLCNVRPCIILVLGYILLYASTWG